MDTLLQDIRYALRSLRRSPGFALVAILIIGLAIGANTTVFTWAQRVLLRPLPGIPQSEELVQVRTGGPGGRSWSVSYPNYRDWRDGTRSYEGLAAYTAVEVSLRDSGPASRAWGVAASGNYFDVLRVRPFLGRTFRPEEEAQAAPVAVISHGLWQRTFGGNPSVLGRRVMLNGIDVTIVGVAPRDFAGTSPGYQFDLWFPVTLYELVTKDQGALARRGSNFLDGTVARLRPGVTIEQARQDANAVHRHVLELNPGANQSTSVLLTWNDLGGATARIRPIAVALLGVAALVLLAACANLANLLHARATVRRREISIRLAVGAGSARLVRQLLTESLVLACGGGVCGVMLAFWTKDMIGALLPPSALPVHVGVSVDAAVVAAAAAVTLATGVLFGLLPALRASRAPLSSVLREGTGGSPGRSRMQGSLVAAQVALSVVSLVCAGLFVRGLERAQRVDTGMSEPERVLLAQADLYAAGYTDSSTGAVLGRLAERVRALPGVSVASWSDMVPLGMEGWQTAGFPIQGYTFGPDERRDIPHALVGPGYFEAVGSPVVRGRGFASSDLADGGWRAAVVNEAFVRRYWPGQEPLGKLVATQPDLAVVGVVRDAKYLTLDEPAQPVIFVAASPGVATLHVRASGDAAALQESLRRAFAEVDPNIALTSVRTLARSMEAATFSQRLGAWSLSAIGVLALALAAVGLFGVLAYSVAQRTREMGVRIAIGASRRDVLALVVGKAIGLTGVGLGVGVVLAAGAGRLLRTQIFGVSPLDPVTFVAVALLLGAVALLAAWLPALRAARVDPIVALQAE